MYKPGGVYQKTAHYPTALKICRHTGPASDSHMDNLLAEGFLRLPELLGLAWGARQVCRGVNMTLPSSRFSTND